MIERKKKILVVDDDRGIHLASKAALKESYDCLSAYNGDEALIILQNQTIDLVLLDLNMRRENEGIEYLPRFKELFPDLDIIICSANTEINLASRAIELGASNYVLKPYSIEQLRITVDIVLNSRKIISENQHHRKTLKKNLEKNQIVGKSPVMIKLSQDIEKIRRSNANVIIYGDTGCGKELVARHLGAMDNKPFVTVDSSTITSTMAESLLFGHERGSFTGAQTQSKGLFEEADGGTIYFDEIANMPLEIQAKLLRVLEEKEVTRLGSTRVIPLTFRVICATNRDLEKMASEGLFKYDLFQRLNVICLTIPKLLERREDIPALIDHFFKKFRYDNSPKTISDEAMNYLINYSWPGNIRELSNLMANLCTMIVDKYAIQPSDLPPRVLENQPYPKKIFSEVQTTTEIATITELQRSNIELRSPDGSTLNLDTLVSTSKELKIDFYQCMHEVEGKVLKRFYGVYGGNISKMSKLLKISRSHLYAKLQAHGIH